MYKYLLVLVIALSSFNGFAQDNKAGTLAKFGADLDRSLTKQERAFIDEVYGDYANKLVYNNPQRLKTFKNILRNRVLINFYKDKDLGSIKNLSSVRLVNSINPNIQSDFSFNKDNFNPLKYNFGFFSKADATYFRVDNTQYLITILPQH